MIKYAVNEPWQAAPGSSALVVWTETIQATAPEFQLARVAALEDVFRSFEPLISYMCNHYVNEHNAAMREDFRQVARMAVLMACQSFDPHRGAFPTHVRWQIRSRLANIVRSEIKRESHAADSLDYLEDSLLACAPSPEWLLMQREEVQAVLEGDEKWNEMNGRSR